MSASEKLRALEVRGAEGKWEIYEEPHHAPADDPKYTDRWILDNGVILNWGDGDIPLGPAELIVSLRNALPQIVAVVEAAEMLVTEAREIHAPEYPSTLKSYRASHAALTALEDALS